MPTRESSPFVWGGGVLTAQDLVKERLPRLSEHFHAHGVTLDAVCVQWFLCLFTKTLPSEVGGERGGG